MSQIDYARMRAIYPKQKAALTRAINTKDFEKVKAACVKAVREWGEIGAWPDDWSRWQRALDDSAGWPWPGGLRLEDFEEGGAA